MEKKTKEALIGYLNNISEVYGLYAQDSFSDEDFLTAAVTDRTLDIMEGCINNKDVKPVLKLMRKVISEGIRARDVPYNDLGEGDDDGVYDSLIAEAENLKAQLTILGGDKMQKKLYEIKYTLSKEGKVKIELTEEDTVRIEVEKVIAPQELKIEDFKIYIDGIKEM